MQFLNMADASIKNTNYEILFNKKHKFNFTVAKAYSEN